MKSVSGFLIVFVLLFVACTKSEPIENNSYSSKLTSITCSETEYAIEAGESVDVAFRVEQPLALFNHVVSSVGCQVELRLYDKPTERPKSITLAKVTPASEKGLYYATIKDDGSQNLYSYRMTIVIKLETGELVRSNMITVKSSNFVGGITEIRLEKSKNSALKKDVVFEYDHATLTYKAHIEEYIASRHFVPSILWQDIDNIKINGSDFDPERPLNFHQDITITVESGKNSTQYSLSLTCFTAIPVMRIETPNRVGIYSKEEWTEQSTLWLDGMGIFEDIDGVQLSIRGRGNSTWGYEKKPYNIKFDKKQEVMGMPKHKRWCLLANYMDRTLIRNKVAYYLAEQTSLAWTPRCEFVELILNGEHLGSYLVAEHIKVDENRVDITEMETTDNSGDAVTGGYLLELDFHFDNEWQWWGASGTPFAVKYPEEEDLTPQQLAWIKGYIGEVESVLYGEGFTDTQNGYAKYIDMQSFVDYWFIYEICVNHELANPGSVYLTKERNGKLCAGPVWDFDWGTFSFNASPQAQWGLFMTHAWWYSRLFKDENFKRFAAERWMELKPKFMTVFGFIDSQSEYIYRSWYKNFGIWSISTTINGDERLSYPESISRLTDVTRSRIEIIDRELSKF